MIREAKKEEAAILSKLSFRSKGYWDYPEKYFEIWRKELTISPEYIWENDVFVFIDDDTIVGYYSIVELKTDIEVSGIRIGRGHWLEHMFIDPEYIGNGIGRKLFDHMVEKCKEKGIRELGILADPNVRGFYEKMGCEYQREYPSTIENRTTPFLLLTTSDIDTESTVRPSRSR